MPKRESMISVADFFSGCGGTSKGLQNAGMDIVLGIDNDPIAAATYRANFPNAQFIERDVKKITFDEIQSCLPKDGPVLFAGCAPCQPYSAQHHSRHSDDPRRDLLAEFGKFVKEFAPEFVLIENVPGLQNVTDKDGPFNRFHRLLKVLNYNIDFGVLRASDFGVPQVRRRFILIAAREKLVRLPSPTHGNGLIPYSTVSDWIWGLPFLEAGEVDPYDPEHASMKLSEINLLRIKATPTGGSRRDWPEELNLSCHDNFKGHSDVYGRMAWNRPASGLTTRCVSLSNGRFGHPEQHRAISVREAALLQTFDKDFSFCGTLTTKARQIGNAVPPLLAQRVGESIIGSLH